MRPHRFYLFRKFVLAALLRQLGLDEKLLHLMASGFNEHGSGIRDASRFLLESQRIAVMLREFSRAIGMPVFLMPPEPTRTGCVDGLLPEDSFCRQLKAEWTEMSGLCVDRAALCCGRVPVLVDGVILCILQAGPLRSAAARLSRPCAPGGSAAMEQKLRKAYDALRKVDHSELEAIESALGMLAAWLVAEAATAAMNHDPPAVKRAKQMAATRADEQLSTREVANACGLSEQHFCRQFKSTTGLTFIQYLSSIRIKRACGMLADHSRRVSEVAFEVGFQSLSRFNAVFRKETGHSPTQWRERHTEPRKPGIQP